jgi:hydroxymethylpyrimidine pyrophosphatase-like HAD family hydrolase
MINRKYRKGKIIAVDFDGTCVTHEYLKGDPSHIGKDIGAAPVLKELVEQGHKIMLYTMRSGEHLLSAIKWFEDNDIPIWSVNENPGQRAWTDSQKQYANLYIDDAALGIPLIFDPIADYVPDRAYVCWKQVRILLEQIGYLPVTAP